MSPKWYSLQQIQKLTNLSRSSLARLEKSHRMPRGIRLTKRCVRFPAESIDLWMAGKWSSDGEVDHE